MAINIDYFKKTKNRGGGGGDDGDVYTGIGIKKVLIKLVSYEVIDE